MNGASCVSALGKPLQPKSHGAMAGGKSPWGSSARVTIGAKRSLTAKCNTRWPASASNVGHWAVPGRRCAGIVMRSWRGLRSAQGPWAGIASGACPAGIVATRCYAIPPRLARWSMAARQPRSCSSTGGRSRARVGKRRGRRGVFCCETSTQGTCVGRTFCTPSSCWRRIATGPRKGLGAPCHGGLPCSVAGGVGAGVVVSSRSPIGAPLAGSPGRAAEEAVWTVAPPRAERLAGGGGLVPSQRLCWRRSDPLVSTLPGRRGRREPPNMPRSGRR